MTGSVDMAARLRAVAGLKLWPNAPLGPFTTMGVGGPAALLAAAATPEAVAAALACLSDAGSPWAFLGAGSNMLVGDKGFAGIVLKLSDELQYVQVVDEDAAAPAAAGAAAATAPADSPQGGDTVILEVGAATPLPKLSALVADWGLSGLEFACAIPGSVGGAVLMNAGAHGAEMSSVVVAVQVAEPGTLRWEPATSLEWRYRSCSVPPGSAVTAVRLCLARDQVSTVKSRRRRYLQWRRENQPRGQRTFGSTFKNPPGDSAGRLLDAAGLKGSIRGGAAVSRVHANFIINYADATAADVVSLMTMMREAVYIKFGLLLEPEVHVLGVSLPWVRT